MIGSQADQFVFRYLIAKKFPKIDSHLTKSSLDTSLVTRSWFLCLFVDLTPVETTLRIWDLLFSEGNKILFRIGLALMKINQTKIIETEDDGISLFQVIKELPESAYDHKTLIKVACSGIGSLPMKVISKERAKQLFLVAEENEQVAKRRAARK